MKNAKSANVIVRNDRIHGGKPSNDANMRTNSRGVIIRAD
jgi:hypothetical protein